MTEILNFLHRSPFTTLCILGSIYYTLKIVLFILPNRVMRHANIRKHGYPPAHCDADGDFLEVDKES